MPIASEQDTPDEARLDNAINIYVRDIKPNHIKGERLRVAALAYEEVLRLRPRVSALVKQRDDALAMYLEVRCEMGVLRSELNSANSRTLWQLLKHWWNRR